MLKLAGGCTLVCSGVLALFIYAIIREDWLVYVYDPAKNFDPLYVPKPPAESAGKLTATFGIWHGCMEATWYSISSWSETSQFKSKHRPDFCYDILAYNDEYLEFERNRFSTSVRFNQTKDVMPTSITSKPTTTPGRDYFRTGYVHTVSPPTTSTTTPIPNTVPGINCPLPPDVHGGTYKIDTPYRYDTISFSRATYSCDNGDYALIGARDYTLQSFCVNGSWTVPPMCTPKDKCLPQGSTWDVCVNGEAWDPPSIVNALGGALPINATDTGGFGVFIFPEFDFDCDGVIRQWDVYSNVSGTFYLTVWKIVGKRFYFVGKNTLESDGTGLQGFVIDPPERIFVRKGYTIGISYDNLLYGVNDSVVPIYRAIDLDQANPKLDWTQLYYSKRAIMVNVTQAYLDNYGHVDEHDSALIFSDIENGDPVIPIIAAYVTGAVLTPIRYKIVQALMVLAALTEFCTIVALFLFIILFARKNESLMGAPLQGAIFLNLFACASAINGVVLLINEYDCNSINPTYGIAIFVALGGIALSAVAIVFLCVADRRLLTVLSRKQYTIVVKPPSALA